MNNLNIKVTKPTTLNYELFQTIFKDRSKKKISCSIKSEKGPVRASNEDTHVCILNINDKFSKTLSSKPKKNTLKISSGLQITKNKKTLFPKKKNIRPEFKKKQSQGHLSSYLSPNRYNNNNNNKNSNSLQVKNRLLKAKSESCLLYYNHNNSKNKSSVDNEEELTNHKISLTPSPSKKKYKKNSPTKESSSSSSSSLSPPSSPQKKKIISPHCFFSIFDGHCLNDCSLFLAETIPKLLFDNKKYKNLEQSKISQYLIEKHIECDKMFFDFCIESGACPQSGSTSLMGILRNNNFTIAHLGDSRAILGEGGKIFELTTDHHPDLKSERDRILKYGGTIVDNRIDHNLAVSKCFGDFEYKDSYSEGKFSGENIVSCVPDIIKFKIKKETDFLLFSCDGLFEAFKSPEAGLFVYQKLIQYKGNYKKVVNELVKEGIKRGSTDNISCCLILFHQVK